MPRARDRDPAQEEEEESQDNMDVAQPLEFDQPLTWKPGKAIPVAELLRRLKTLSEELKTIEQEVADRDSLSPKAQELANRLLLEHKDKGVRAYALLCIVEMFRLLAPDAPYKQGQLKDIFTLFISHVIPALANPADPYNQQHMESLMSLKEVKSISLVVDISGSETMMLNLFTNCFDVMSGTGQDGEKLPKNLEYHMTSMLCLLVEECAPLPSGVVDIILAQFLRADPSTLSGGRKNTKPLASDVLLEPSSAYNMARSVCNTCAETMDRAIGQYFSSVLIDASSTFSTAKPTKSKGKKRTRAESEDESDDDGLMTPPAEADLEEVGKAHRLLRELWRSSPDVVQNIIPQLEAEVEGENADLRTLAVQTIGDMCAGIGAAGPPPVTPMDPAAYPSQSLDSYRLPAATQNVLLMPAAPHAFPSVYPNAYSRFATRYKDKSASVRASFASAAGSILLTSGGGKGLEVEEEEALLKHLSDLLQDHDERVRLAAVQTIANFDFATVMQRLCRNGGVADVGSPLYNLAERVRDTKQPVSCAAISALARIWGVGSGAIAEGSDHVRQRLGAIPSKILDGMFANKPPLTAYIIHTIYEHLLPISYPPIRSKPAPTDSQRINDSQPGQEKSLDPDAIRAERILVLVRDLEGRDGKVRDAWNSIQAKQLKERPRYLDAYLKASEEAVVKGDSQKAKDSLEKFINLISIWATDPELAREHLRKFAKLQDRRSFHLMRLCWSPDSDYRKVYKAMKEFTSRMEEGQSSVAPVLETLLPLLRSASILVYNKSHVHPIVEYSRTDHNGLGSAAQAVLKEISDHAPPIFKAHVHELCETLKRKTPAAGEEEDVTVVDTLKACASFARRFPAEMPKDREFYKAMVAFATQSTLPKAAKHAITVIISSAEKKDMYIKEIKKACIDKFEYGGTGFVARLAAISQLKLLASKECEDKSDRILEIVADECLRQVRVVAGELDLEWDDNVDDDLAAKLWALKTVVNGLRGFMSSAPSDIPDAEVETEAHDVYRLLNTLIEDEGELVKDKEKAMPSTQKAHLRLTAANQLLKLSRNRKLDTLMLKPVDFDRLSTIAQDPLPQVRSGFVNALKKHLASKALVSRFYPLVFLYAFEPKKETLQSTTTWLRSRAATAEKQMDTSIEASFARLLSLLAHHPDFSKDLTDLEYSVGYIVFYLKSVASPTNLSKIFSIAQRLKTVQDGVAPDKSENLYILADIAEAVVRLFNDAQHGSQQLTSMKVSLPSGLFRRLAPGTDGQHIAETRYIPSELADQLEDMVKDSLKTKKRKAHTDSAPAAKKARHETAEKTKKAATTRKPSKSSRTPRKRAVDSIPSSDRRKSTRASGVRTYAEQDDSEDDEEMEQWQVEEDVGSDGNKENVESTPPTSDPTPAPAPREVEVEETAKAKRSKRAVSDEKAAAKKPVTKKAPGRAANGRSTRARGKKDTFDVPDNSDEDMADADAGAQA